MYIRTISLEHLRNHEQSSLECSPLLNIITGLNGSGKTTILEAISICGLSKTKKKLVGYIIICYKFQNLFFLMLEKSNNEVIKK